MSKTIDDLTASNILLREAIKQAEAQQLPMTEREMYNVFVHVCDDGSAPSFADFLTEVELIKYTRAIETWIKGKN